MLSGRCCGAPVLHVGTTAAGSTLRPRTVSSSAHPTRGWGEPSPGGKIVEIHALEEVIGRHPFFQGLSEENLKLLAGCARNAIFEEGEFLMREGEEANTFYLMREGLAALEVHAPGREAVRLQTVGAGDVVGWSWLFPPYRVQYTVRALSRVRAVAFDGRCLRQKCEENPRLGYELMKRTAAVMLQRLQATRLQLLDVYGSPSAVGRKGS